MKKTLLTVIGFFLFLIGSIALVLSLLSLNLTYLSFLEDLPSPMGLVTKIVFIMGGLIMMYTARLDTSIE